MEYNFLEHVVSDIGLDQLYLPTQGLQTQINLEFFLRTDIILNYKQFIRTVLEYCSVAFHSSLTVAQSDSLERCQLRII